VRRRAGGLILTWRPRGSTTLSAGVDYEDERQRGRSEFNSSTVTFGQWIDVQRWTAGYYAQAVLDASRLAITAGARLDDNSKFDTHGTYRVGLVVRARAETRLRFSAGTGFKEPTFFENFASGFVLGNPNLDPERTTSWEAGVDRTLAGGRLTLVATYFDQRFRDLIDFTQFPLPGEPNYFNVPGAISRGVELDVNGMLTPAFTVALRYAYLDAHATKAGADTSADALFVPGKRLLRRPAHSLAPEIGMTVGARTRIIVSARWVGRRDDLDFNRPAGSRRVTLAPYTHVNVSAEYTLGSIALTGKVENAFDDPSEEVAAFRPRGRTVMLGGRVTVGR
jgi:vitamin B12 transporter